MKSKILCLCALILGLVSCHQDKEVNTPVPEKVRFTASIETTRTFLGEDLSVLWSHYDVILLWHDDDGYWASEQLNLIDGAETNAGVFEGTITKPLSSYHYATYGESWRSPYEASITDQSYVPGSFGGNYGSWWDSSSSAPMIATLEAESTNLLFKNVTGLIKLDIAGSGILESISLHDKNETTPLNGGFSYDPDTLSILEWPWPSYYTSLQNINVELNEEPQSFYIVLPPATIEEMEVTMYFNNASDSVTVTATNPITISRGVITPVTPAITVEAPTHEWHIVGSMNDWTPEDGIVMEAVEGTDLVAAYDLELYDGSEFVFTYGTSWDNGTVGYLYGGYVYADYLYSGVLGGENIRIGKTGTYDIYLNPENFEFYIINAGNDWRNAIYDDIFGSELSVIGDMLNDNWSNDYPMHYLGEGLYRTENITFADANVEGAAFKIRLNNNWKYSLGVPSVDDIYSVDSPIDVSCAYGANIVVDAIIGIRYDVWFDIAERKVWVTHHGYTPGEPVEMIEHQMPYMYGGVFESDNDSYNYFAQIILSQTHVYYGWTLESSGYDNFLFSIYFNESKLPARIILGDESNTCFMSYEQLFNGLFRELENGRLSSIEYFDSVVMDVTENGIELYATIDRDILHIVYGGELKLGFYNQLSSNGGTETFIQRQEFNPEWK